MENDETTGTRENELNFRETGDGMFVVENPIEAVFNSKPAGSPSIEEREGAVYEEIGASPSAKAWAAFGQSVIEQGKVINAQYAAVRGERYLTAEGKAKQMTAMDAEYQEKLALRAEAGLKILDGIEKAYVMQADPTFPPKDAAHASAINGLLSDLDSYTPAIATKVARSAIANGDRPLAARILSKLESFAEYKAAYRQPGNEAATVIHELTEFLITDDVIRSNAAKQWLQNARHNLTYLIRRMRDQRGFIDPIEINVLNSFKS